MLMQFSTTWEPVKFNAQAIITSLTGATTILIQLSPAGLIPGLMLMQLSPPTMAHSLMLMQLSPTTLDHDQFSCNFQLLPTKFCNAHLMQHYNYHQIRWILTENWMRIEWELTFHFCLGDYSRWQTELVAGKYSMSVSSGDRVITAGTNFCQVCKQWWTMLHNHLTHGSLDKVAATKTT